ncbi:IS110 family transposase [Brevibacterium sediminis]|uniref:IS110 family transposase n=1 Tax=Brevibacterium sediminis TaxID=1857024 RepID=UPI002174F9D7|nr:IS110 family transposase [Brevibacterium sediminis]MCS4592696.1 IS110 family transposase [Brevibacterium sediminis]
MNTEYDVWLGLDVGKTSRHGFGLGRAGERVFDYELPQDEVALRDVITTLQDEQGRVLVIVDQPNMIGALPVAVARVCGADIAYLPGLAMRKALTCIRVRRRLMPGMRSPSPIPPERCHILRGRWIGSRMCWQTSKCWLVRMKTWRTTLRERSTGYGPYCSRSTPRWNASSKEPC